MMENEILKSLSQLAKWAGSSEELEAVKTCVQIFKLEHRKNGNLLRMCEEVDGVIYQRSNDLHFYWIDKSQY